jgi:SAM-dependent methyltransferase
MSFIDLFSEKSELYATARPTYPDELFSILAGLAAAHECVWDCATGNGQAAIGLAGHFDRVKATDASEAQISNAIASERVHYSVQPAERTNFEAASFDAVCVAQALHWFDHSRFFPEVHRVLRPHGVFAAWTYDRISLSPEINRVLKETIYDVIAPYWPKQNTLAWNGYKDVPFPFERIELEPPPMRFEWTLPQFLAHVHTWSATRRCMNDAGADFFDHAGERLGAIWGDPGAPQTVTMRLQWILGRHAA